MSKRRLSNRELNKQLNDMQNIDKLLNKSKKQYKNNNIQMVSTQIITNKESNLSNVKMSPHAIKRAKERFNMDQPTAIGYFKSKLLESKMIGLQTDKYGNKAILYANGRIGIYVSIDHKEIKTVIKQESLTYEPIKNKVAELHAKEFRKITRKESTQERRLHDAILEVNVEIASLELRKHKTRSQAVKNACVARVAALKMHIDDMRDELKQLKDMKRQIARSMISVV